MQKNGFLVCILMAVLSFVAVSCEDDDSSEPPEQLYALAGTSWRLIAIVEDNVSREPDYRDGYHDRTYTLTFNDSVLVARSEINKVWGPYSADYHRGILYGHELRGTAACCDKGDGELYLAVFEGLLGGSSPFKSYPEELYIFYNEGKGIFKFNRIDYIEDP